MKSWIRNWWVDDVAPRDDFFAPPRSRVFPFVLPCHYKLVVPVSQTMLGAFAEFQPSKVVISGTTDSWAFGHMWTLNLGFVEFILSVLLSFSVTEVF